MTTKLNKPVFRESYAVIRDRSKRREVVVGLLPGDVIEFRPKGTRYRVSASIDVLWSYVAKLDAANKARIKKEQREAKRRMRWQA